MTELHLVESLDGLVMFGAPGELSSSKHDDFWLKFLSELISSLAILFLMSMYLASLSNLSSQLSSSTVSMLILVYALEALWFLPNFISNLICVVLVRVV